MNRRLANILRALQSMRVRVRAASHTLTGWTVWRWELWTMHLTTGKPIFYLRTRAPRCASGLWCVLAPLDDYYLRNIRIYSRAARVAEWTPVAIVPSELAHLMV
jgi:hypothetical protein